ncbi:hypothetical protein RJ639_023321 [Escallonia herrerae]|uniref:Chromo domain-containing protein n=1 Tax=Escallonia herrerae TaxID=1293975 RepID=A0AA89AF86_9ASTE|nr:hypothetical protein RJ639_023321 [Escallonia herrerae]
MQTKPSIVGISWQTLLASGKSSATHGFLYAIKGHRVSGGTKAAISQGTVASAKKILLDSLLRKTMANTKERIDALEAQIQGMFKNDQDAPGILKQFSLRLDALEVNLEATDNARYAENMEWEGKFQELQDRVEHHARHVEDIEQYFRAIRVDSEATKVSMVAMYLVGDAKLWWRKQYVQCGEQSGSQSRHPPTEEQTNAQDYEEEDAVGAFPQWCNAVTTQARWQELLAEFNFMLEYRVGSTNSVVDALSRRAELDQKYEGPLTIVKKMGKMAYKVDPPHWWSRQLHPVFHVSMLKPFYEDTADPFRGQIKRQGLKPKKAGKRVAKAILNDRVITASCKRHQEYLVKWQGYMEEENTWE